MKRRVTRFIAGAMTAFLLAGCGCTGSSRSREILKNPVFMRVLRRGKTYENPRKRTHSTREIHR